MVYKFDPMHFNGTIFDLDDTCVMAKGSSQLDDRFHENGSHGTGELFEDSSYAAG